MKQWQQFDTDLWRLEQWLSDAEAKIIKSKDDEPPSNADQLEDAIQSQKTLMVSLNSHKSVVQSLKSVGKNIMDRIEAGATKDQFSRRLATVMERWEGTSRGVIRMQGHLQANLLDNDDFQQRTETLTKWLDTMETQITHCEPVDLNADATTLHMKYYRFKELKEELERCEPRVVSLYNSVDMLFDHNIYYKSATQIKAMYQRLDTLSKRVPTLVKLCDTYCQRLHLVINAEKIEESEEGSQADSILSLSSEFLRSSRSPESLDRSDSAAGSSVLGAASAGTGVVSRRSGGGFMDFLRRVLRASLPIQALMLLILGLASLVPCTEEDYMCSFQNTLHNSIYPVLRHTHGSPPF